MNRVALEKAERGWSREDRPMTFADRARDRVWNRHPYASFMERMRCVESATWAHADGLADPTDEEVEPVAREILWMHVTANPDRATQGQWDQARRLARVAIAAFLAARRGSE